jgi:hypothetical protein
MHSTNFPLSRFQIVVTVFLAIVSVRIYQKPINNFIFIGTTVHSWQSLKLKLPFSQALSNMCLCTLTGPPGVAIGKPIRLWFLFGGWDTTYVCVANSDTDPKIRALNTEVTVLGGLSNASVENCIGECKSLKFDVAGMKQQTCCTCSMCLHGLPFSD